MTSMAVVPIDPMTLFIAAAVVNMDRKLDDIKETQQAILDFIEDNEKAKHIGNINALNEITDAYLIIRTQKRRCYHEGVHRRFHICLHPIALKCAA